MPLCDGCRRGIKALDGQRCGLCGRPLYSEKELCFPCRERKCGCEEIHPLFLYQGDAARLLKAYKSGKRPSLASFFVELLAERISERWPGRPIVPVPPRAEKIRFHQWDQVEEIARGLEKKGFRLLKMLKRNPSREQKKLDKKNRSLNAREAYELKHGMAGGAEGLPLLLLDDVCTTGATIEACAQLLSASGAPKVAAIVIAAD